MKRGKEIQQMKKVIKDALDRVALPLAAKGMKDTSIWTAAALGAVTKAGNRLNFYTCAAAKQASYNSEWLFDACWLEYEGDLFRRVVLVAECEWWAANPAEYEDDFAKLVVAKADLRLFICEVQNQEKADELVKWLRQYASGFNATWGDEYLISCWVIDDQKFVHESLVAKR